MDKRTNLAIGSACFVASITLYAMGFELYDRGNNIGLIFGLIAGTGWGYFAVKYLIALNKAFETHDNDQD